MNLKSEVHRDHIDVHHPVLENDPVLLTDHPKEIKDLGLEIEDLVQKGVDHHQDIEDLVQGVKFLVLVPDILDLEVKEDVLILEVDYHDQGVNLEEQRDVIDLVAGGHVQKVSLIKEGVLYLEVEDHVLEEDLVQEVEYQFEKELVDQDQAVAKEPKDRYQEVKHLDRKGVLDLVVVTQKEVKDLGLGASDLFLKVKGLFVQDQEVKFLI